MLSAMPLTSGSMNDHEVERRLLATYLSLLDAARESSRLSGTPGEALRELNKIAPGIRRILRITGPDLGSHPNGNLLANHLAAEHAVSRALRLLATQDEWESSQDPDNPVFPAAELHPVVWAAARELWKSRMYRQAVQAAASAVNDFAQRRLGRRDLSDVALMQEAFSTNAPTTDMPRLRCPGNQSDLSVRDQQQGALQYAVGCFKAMRNPATHEIPQWNPLTAFEYIIAFSLLARWIDFWDLEVAPSPPTASPPPQPAQSVPPKRARPANTG
jgi:uncharacterized protein (TIGR02391 family)